MDLRGVIPPMITPTAGATVDREQLATFTEHLVTAGVDALLPVGSVGEFPSLTIGQRGDVVETVVSNAEDCPVIAGCGGTSVGAVQRQLDQAADAGATAGLVVAPYYFSPGQAGLRRFYREVAGDAPIPVLLYDIPKFTGVTLSPATVGLLAQEPGIVGIKDSTSDLPRLLDTIDAVPEEFVVLQGNPLLGMVSLEAGVDGIVAGPANVFPAETVAWDDAYRRGDHEQATRIAREMIMPVLQAKREMPTPTAFKHMLSRLGFPVGEPLPPLRTTTETDRELLDACLDTVTSAGVVEPPW